MVRSESALGGRSEVSGEGNPTTRFANGVNCWSSRGASQDLDKKERLLAFKEYILGLEREEAEEKRKAVEAEKEKLREARHEFRSLLIECRQKRLLNPLTRWKEFEQVMADGEVANAKIREKFKELVEIIGDSKPWPMHLFNDYVGALYRDFNTDRRVCTICVVRA